MDFDQTIYAQIFRFILGFICVLGNIFILCLFWRYKKLRKAPYNVLVALLAISDLLIGIGVFIRGSYGMYTATNDIHIFTKRSCQLANIVSGFGITSNQAIIIGVAADRLTAVWRPTSYTKNFSMIIPSVSFAIATIYVILIGYISVAGSNPDDLITVCSMAPASTQIFSITFAVTSGTQAILVNAIYIASLILVKKRLSLIGGSGTSSTSRKVFIYVTLILVTQIIFWEIPIVFLIISMLFQLPPGTKAYVTLAIGFGSALNAAIGTLICIFKNHEIREYTKAFFGRQNSVISAGHSLKNAQTTTVAPTSTSRRHTVIVTLT
uniref:G-protein coupled receptors family 1 profile domain-containing protein n=1 Tax=Panagrolaimus sp. ES5 TaxID=591445 RepID=A0AC34FMU8_9BILA